MINSLGFTGRKGGFGKRLTVLFLAGLWLLTALFTGCSSEEQKVQDLEFTVVPDREVPEELAKVIQEKKTETFQLTYSTKDALYLVVGYGRQDSGGYSIQVKELYLTESSLVLDTELVGPEKTSAEGEEPSFPYLVLRTELREEPVVFR